ncbi:MAG: hypothetical protein ACRBCS_02940 [Cellvibrionaceae bacterium]
MREFGQDYLYKVSVEPERGYHNFEKRKKPFYVVAATKEKAAELINLKSGWRIKSVSLLAEQYSGALFGSRN